VAIALTASMFALAVTDVLLVGRRRGVLLPLDVLLHGWPLVAANVVFYVTCAGLHSGLFAAPTGESGFLQSDGS
jgi:hypothetical protein